MKQRCWLIATLFVLVLAICQGCGGQSGSDTSLATHDEAPAVAAPAYPLPGADGLLAGAKLDQPGVVIKARSKTPQTVVPGTALNNSVGAVVSPAGNGAIRLAAVPGEDVSWAMYRVGELKGDRPVSLLVDAAPVEGSGGEYYVAFGDYSNFSWDWHGPFTEAVELELNNADSRARVIDAGYTMTVIVLQHSASLPAGAAVDLHGITVSQLPAGSPQYYCTRPLFTKLDAVWVGAAPGSKGANDLLPAQYVTLTWTHEDDLLSTCAILQYQIWRWDIYALLSEDPVHIGTVLAPEETYVDPLDNASTAPELIPGHAYIYFLKAWNNAGEARWSFLDAVIIPELAEYHLSASDELYYDKISLAWNAADNAEWYEVWVDDAAEPLATVAAGDAAVPGEPGRCQWEHTGLAVDETHTYRVRALTASSSLNFSNSDAGSTKPGAAYELEATDDVYFDHITTEWNAIENASQYEMWLDDQTEPHATASAEDVAHPTEAGRCRWVHAGLAPGESHTYRVRALLPAGALGFSNSDAGSTKIDAEYELNCTDGVHFDHITAEWNAIENASQYEMWLDDETEPHATASAEDVAHPTATGRCQWVHAGLAPGESHTYRVRALLPTGTLSFSNSDAGSTHAAFAYTLSASDSLFFHVIELVWNQIENAIQYEIWLDSETAPHATVNAADVAHPTETGRCLWEHTGLGYAEVHTYRVRAVLAAGTANFSNSDQGHTHPEVAYNLQASDAAYLDKIELVWNAIAGCLQYEIYLDGGATPHTVISAASAVHPSEPGRCMWEHTGLAPEESHTYSVRALLAIGAANASATDTGSTSVLQEWIHTIGGPGEEVFYDVVPNQYDEIYAVGLMDSYGAGGDELLVAQYSMDGNLNWVQGYGDAGNSWFRRAGVDSSGNLIAMGIGRDDGFFGYDAWGLCLFKFDRDGGILWKRFINWGDDYSKYTPQDMQIDDEDNIYIAGFSSESNADQGRLLKFSNDGSFMWEEPWTPFNSNLEMTSLRIGNNGDIYIAAHRLHGGNWSPVVLKYDTNRNLLWKQELQLPGNSLIFNIEFDLSGSVYLVGQTNSGGEDYNVLVIKYSSSGAFVWAYKWGGDAFDEPWQAATNPDGGIVICGRTHSFNDTNGDGMLLMVSETGQFSCSTYNAGSHDNFLGLHLTTDGILFISGLALNNSGSFVAVSGGTTNALSPTLIDPGVNSQTRKTWLNFSPIGQATAPQLVIDNGGGGHDAIIIMKKL